MFSPQIEKDIVAHAKQTYPNECCGLVVGPSYMPMENIAEDPKNEFRIDPAIVSKYIAQKRLRAVVHSHTNMFPIPDKFPSKKDMIQQEATNVPWGVVHIDDKKQVDGPFWFGDQLPVAEYVGREFRHGVTDCYALLRDIYRNDLHITLPIFGRDPLWWKQGQDMISENFENAGFHEVPKYAAQKYDVGLFAIQTNGIINHVGVYMGDGIMYHHLIDRVSRPDPIEPWMKYLVKLVRHESLFE